MTYNFIFIVTMRTRMDDTIHVKVEIVDRWDRLSRAKTSIENVWVLISQPAKHFWDTKKRCAAATTAIILRFRCRQQTRVHWTTGMLLR